MSGRNFDHRKGWILELLQLPTSVFAIDVCAYALLSNHYHITIHVDAARARRWDDDEVIRRWLQLFGGNTLANRYVRGDALSEAEQRALHEQAAVWRERLYDISWFMRYLNESAARRANQEDACTGRFWEGRFKSQALLDEAALLASMLYVDLNPIRAGLCETPEESDFTSIQARIRAYAQERERAAEEQQDGCHTVADGDAQHALEPSLPPAVALLPFAGAIRENQERALIPFFVGAVERLRALAKKLGCRCLRGVSANHLLFGT